MSDFAAISKSIFASKTVWTMAVGLVAEILTLSGVHVLDDPTMQATVVAMLMAVFGALFRVTATQPLHVTPPAP
jgi:hypothetical protein